MTEKCSLAQKRRMLMRSKALATMDRGSSRTNLLTQSVPELDSIDNVPSSNTVFPSLPDNVLRVLGLLVQCDSQKNLNEPDIEEQFARLSLAFKTDKLTLSKRVDLQQRRRDIAEKNIESELKSLRESLNALNQLCANSDMRDVITKTQQHVDIVQQTTMRMSSEAETYGAIQQEQRMSCAFETLSNYIEHLKMLYDKEHIELEEYRRLLAEHNLLPDEKAAIEGADDSKRVLPPRSHSLSSSSKPEARARIHSAICLLNDSPDSSQSFNGSSLSSNLSLSPKSRRASLPVGPMSTSYQSVTNLSPIQAMSAASFHNGSKFSKEAAGRKESVAEVPEEKSALLADKSDTGAVIPEPCDTSTAPPTIEGNIDDTDTNAN